MRGKEGRVYGGVRLQSGFGFTLHSSPNFIVCGPVPALKCPLREPSTAEILCCWCRLPAETLVWVFPRGLSVWCHHSAVVGFSPPVKPPAQREREGRCQCSSPRGFHCGTSVASVTSGCLLHSCGASKRKAGPDREIYCFPPWWQCPAQVHRDLRVPWVLSIDCLQRMEPSLWV